MEYIDMSLELQNIRERKQLEEGVEFKSVDKEDLEQCWLIYQECFGNGDAEFYFGQSPEERREFFDHSLGLPDAMDYDESALLLKDGRVIGFCLGIDYGAKNFHISCMCILPQCQGNGLGKMMLDHIATRALQRGQQTLSLGTEKDMKAYVFYQACGFEDVQDIKN